VSLPTEIAAAKEEPMSIKSISHKLNEWRRYRASIRELSRLTDRELADLGIGRADIEFVAKKSARY
jgi:uncharacterized protein YjiS (DUF1127 family)